MREKGWTNKAELERESGVGHSALYDVLGGKGNPTPEIIARLATALDVEGPDFALVDATNPGDLSGLIGQAQRALDAAASLLATSPPGESGPAAIDRVHRHTKAGGKAAKPRKDRRAG